MPRSARLKPVEPQAGPPLDPALERLGHEVQALRLEVASLKLRLSEAEALADAIAAEPVMFEGAAIRLKASWGVCGILPPCSAADVLAEADAAMFGKKPAAG